MLMLIAPSAYALINRSHSILTVLWASCSAGLRAMCHLGAERELVDKMVDTLVGSQAVMFEHGRGNP